MLYVNDDGVIRLTRGDSARFTVTIKNNITNSDYELKDNDVLRFTIRKSVKTNVPAVQKILTGSNQFCIEPNDTKDLPFGKYLYDVELTTALGDVCTIIVPTTFEILTEVTY